MSENNAVALATQNKSVEISNTLVPRNLVEIKELATFLAASDLIPKSLMGRKENVALVLLMGHEIGCGGVAALRNIYVVNGRPAIYGDLATALVRKSGLCEELDYKFEGSGPTLKCIATGKRKGMKDSHTEEFSWADAVTGGLVEKNPNYKKFPKDSVMWKALHRLFKFLWPDVLHGISLKEIVADEVSEAEVVGSVEIISEPVSAPAEPKKRGPKPKAHVEAPVSPASEVLADVPAEPAEAPMEEPKSEPKSEPVAEAKAETAQSRVIGTMVQCIRLLDFPGKYAAKVNTADGECRYLFESLEAAQAAKPFANRTVTLFVEPLETPIAGIMGKIVKCEAVA